MPLASLGLVPDPRNAGGPELPHPGDRIEVEHVGEQLLALAGLDANQALGIDDQAAAEAGGEAALSETT